MRPKRHREILETESDNFGDDAKRKLRKRTVKSYGENEAFDELGLSEKCVTVKKTAVSNKRATAGKRAVRKKTAVDKPLISQRSCPETRSFTPQNSSTLENGLLDEGLFASNGEEHISQYSFTLNEVDEDPERANETENGTKNVFQHEKFFNSIGNFVDKTPGEVLSLAFKYIIRHNLSSTAASDLVSLINGMFAETVLPDAQSMLNDISKKQYKTKLYTTCPKCLAYIGEITEPSCSITCVACKSKVELSLTECPNYLIVTNPSDQIAELLAAHDEYYSDVMKERKYNKGHVKDIYDGKRYRCFLKSLPVDELKNYCTAIINTNAVPPLKCEEFSIWPVHMLINEIPIESRLSNVITCGLWIGKRKPAIQCLLSPVIDMLNELSTSGIRCTIKGESRIIKLYPVIASVDSLTRAALQGMKQFNGVYGCNWCEQEGVWCEGKVRYHFLVKEPLERDHDSIAEKMKRVYKSGRSAPGIQHSSPLMSLNSFNIVTGFVPDYRHSCLLGVGKQITECILKKAHEHDITLMNSILLHAEVPYPWVRLGKNLNQRNSWTDIEWENWVLYYSLPLLNLVIPNPQVEHWNLFVQSLHVLLSTHITFLTLNKVYAMLEQFVTKVPEYYSLNAMTLNIHFLLHIPKSVYNWGPLWVQSSFPFENENNNLLNAIKSAKGEVFEIARKLNMMQSLNLLESQIDRIMFKPDRFPERTNTGIRYLGTGTEVDDNIRIKFSLVNGKCKCFDRMVKSKCLYFSSLSENPGASNSVVQLVDGKVLRVVAFIVDYTKNRELTIGNIIKMAPLDENDKIGSVTSFSDEIVAVSTMDICRICVLIATPQGGYVCPVPNFYYRKLC